METQELVDKLKKGLNTEYYLAALGGTRTKDNKDLTLTIKEAEHILSLLDSPCRPPNENVDKSSWSIGKIVVVTNCIYGHEFEDGVIVEIIGHDPTQTSSWLCSDGKNSWWLTEEEGYIR